MIGDASADARRLLVAELVSESAVFQRNVAWANLAETRAARAGTILSPMAPIGPGDAQSVSGNGGGLPASGGIAARPCSDAPILVPELAGREDGNGPRERRSPALRIALVSSPRTGNTWLRTLLAESFGLTEMAVHAPTDLPWLTLPDRLILQLHWHRLPAFRVVLRELDFRVVTIARHPLDILVSVLQFCQSERSTEFWLSGEGGDERSLVGASPHDRRFLQWALSARARALLSVTPEWWDDSEAIRVRYEDLVARPAAALVDIAKRLGAESVRDVGEVGRTLSLNEMRLRFAATPGHFWKGRPGMGTEVLDSTAAGAIVAAHAAVFRVLEYPNRLVERSREQARMAWIESSTAPSRESR